MVRKTTPFTRLEGARSYNYAKAIVIATEIDDTMPFGIAPIFLGEMTYGENAAMLSSFWNHRLFTELFEHMAPAEIISFLVGSGVVKKTGTFRKWADGNEGWQDNLVGSLYQLSHQSNAWGYGGDQKQGIHIVNALKQQSQSPINQSAGEERKRLEEVARIYPGETLKLLESALADYEFSSREILKEVVRGARYSVIDGDGGPANKGWYVNENMRKLEAIAEKVPTITDATS
jgi:hypothetical protein